MDFPIKDEIIKRILPQVKYTFLLAKIRFWISCIFGKSKLRISVKKKKYTRKKIVYPAIGKIQQLFSNWLFCFIWLRWLERPFTFYFYRTNRAPSVSIRLKMSIFYFPNQIFQLMTLRKSSVALTTFQWFFIKTKADKDKLSFYSSTFKFICYTKKYFI